MSAADFIQAMPKVELNVQLHGAMKPQTIATIADQNDVTENLRQFQNQMRLYTAPELSKVDEIARIVSSWVMQPDDLKLLVYEMATMLHHQNVRYAEIAVDPTLYSALQLQPEDFLSVINDGRDRAQRAWGIKVAWVITIPRDEPRRAEEVVRWTTTMAARKAGIIGLGLAGRESVLPAGQFERPFKMAEKRETARVIRAGDEQQAEGILAALNTLSASRIIDGRGLTTSAEAMEKMRSEKIGLCINLTRAVRHKWVSSVEEYPLRALYDAGLLVTLSSDMATLYGTSLTQEYQSALDAGLVSLEELQELALNGVRASFLPPEEKAEMEAAFKAEYAKLSELYV